MSPGPKSHSIIPVKKDFPLDSRPRGIPRISTGNVFNSILTNMIKNPVHHYAIGRAGPNPNLSGYRSNSELPTMESTFSIIGLKSPRQKIGARNIRLNAKAGAKTIKSVGFPKGVVVASL